MDLVQPQLATRGRGEGVRFTDDVRDRVQGPVTRPRVGRQPSTAASPPPLSLHLRRDSRVAGSGSSHDINQLMLLLSNGRQGGILGDLRRGALRGPQYIP